MISRVPKRSPSTARAAASCWPASMRVLRSASRKRNDGAAQKVRVVTCKKNGQPGLFPWFRQTTQRDSLLELFTEFRLRDHFLWKVGRILDPVLGDSVYLDVMWSYLLPNALVSITTALRATE